MIFLAKSKVLWTSTEVELEFLVFRSKMFSKIVKSALLLFQRNVSRTLFLKGSCFPLIALWLGRKILGIWWRFLAALSEPLFRWVKEQLEGFLFEKLWKLRTFSEFYLEVSRLYRKGFAGLLNLHYTCLEEHFGEKCVLFRKTFWCSSIFCVWAKILRTSARNFHWDFKTALCVSGRVSWGWLFFFSEKYSF